jgi:hypothetical protein
MNAMHRERATSPRRPAGKPARLAAALVLGALLGLVAAPARADDHDPESSGHPLRVVAYVLHPVGVVLDTLIFRPAHWVAHHEPFTTLFGHDHDDEY